MSVGSFPSFFCCYGRHSSTKPDSNLKAEGRFSSQSNHVGIFFKFLLRIFKILISYSDHRIGFQDQMLLFLSFPEKDSTFSMDFLDCLLF